MSRCCCNGTRCARSGLGPNREIICRATDDFAGLVAACIAPETEPADTAAVPRLDAGEAVSRLRAAGWTIRPPKA